MKSGKKTLVALTFFVGACIFVVTALADIAMATGYDRLKEAVKFTAEQLHEHLDSFTAEWKISLQMDDRILYENISTMKADRNKRASETTDIYRHINQQRNRQSHSYRDETIIALKTDDDENYRVWEYARNTERWLGWTNPFKEKGAEDIEKIFDALVGNLKDEVIVEERSTGGYTYRGSLSETQVPALYNAVLSFFVKQLMQEEVIFGSVSDNVQVSLLEKDIHVKKISGVSEQTADGILESTMGEIVLSGTDQYGKRHDLRFAIEMNVTDINQTTVTKPDLTNAEIIHVYDDHDRHSFTDKHIGTYKSDIIIETKDAFEKVGEQTLTIDSVDDMKLTGTYSVVIYPEYAEQYGDESMTIPFTTMQFMSQTVFSYEDAEGNERFAEIWPDGPGRVTLFSNLRKEGDYLLYPEHGEQWDSRFTRVFD